MNTCLVVVGALGDLVSRFTLPALAHLEADLLLPPGTAVVAVDRRSLTTAEYRQHAERLLAAHASAVPGPARRRVVERLEYRSADVEHERDLAEVLGDGPCVVYLALPPRVAVAAVRLLGRPGLAPGSRVVVEKPVGVDRTSAADLERALHLLVDDASVFRVDHFLHHRLLRDVLSVRSGGLFAPLWSARFVERVDVVWEEAAPVGGRGAFYDETGALRDMVQSHLLQLLSAVAMELPAGDGAEDLRGARADLLARVIPPDPGEIGLRTLRGRYAAGVVRRGPDGTSEEVLPYAEEPGVDAGRLTETYARVDLRVAGPRWQGVRFSLRTGRAISPPRRHVRVTFRRDGTTDGPLTGGRPALTFDMGGVGAPGTTRLSLGDATWGQDTALPDLSHERPAQQLPASASMLRDVLDGDLRWFLSADEVDQSWRVVDAVRAAWCATGAPLAEYPAGSSGPEPGPDTG